jgi:hypothetical protein
MNKMTELLSTESAQKQIDRVTDNQHDYIETLVPFIGVTARKLIPRNQNKTVAERTSDMFMNGLMCE